MTSGDRLVTASAHGPHGPAAGARLAAVVARSGLAHAADAARAADAGLAVFVVIMVIVVVAITIAGRHARRWGPRSRSSVPPTRSQRAAAADEAAALSQGDPSNPDAPGNQQDDL
jgi:hypothetical protein